MKIRPTIFFLALLLLTGVTQAQKQNPFDLSFRKQQLEEKEQKLPVPEDKQVDSSLLQKMTDKATTENIQIDKGQKIKKAPVVKGNPFEITGPVTREEKPEYEVLPEVPKVTERLVEDDGMGSLQFWVLLITVLLLTVFINLNRSLPGQFYKAIFNENYLKYLQRSYTSDARLLYGFFYFFFVLNGGIFVFLVLRHFTGMTGLTNLFLCWLGVLLIYLFRHQFISYIKYVYPLEKTFGVLNFSIMVYNAFLGMILLPVNIIMAFSPDWLMVALLYLGLAIVIGLYIIRELRAIMNSLPEISAHPVHFFLYLCACEIMPVLIVGKFLHQAV